VLVSIAAAAGSEHPAKFALASNSHAMNPVIRQARVGRAPRHAGHVIVQWRFTLATFGRIGVDPRQGLWSRSSPHPK
jgi:hypothetical protein